MLCPSVESASQPVSCLEHSAHPPVASCENSLQIAGVRLVIIERHTFYLEFFREVNMLVPEHLRCILRCPLERGVRLRHEVRNAYGHSEPAALSASQPVVYIHDVTSDLADPVKILIRFARQPVHEIQLYVIPSELDSLFDRTVYVLFRYILVDYIPETLTSRLRCEGESGFPVSLYLIQHFERKRIESERRKRQCDVLRRAHFH